MHRREMVRRAVVAVRGLRDLVRHPVGLAEARRLVTDEVRRRPARFLGSLDQLVWPYPASPSRRLLETAGLEAGDVRTLVADEGLSGALAMLRDAGVYVSYEEYQGKVDVRRGSAVLHFSPSDFFNPVVPADYMATTGGSRTAGTPVEVSFAWQRRQGAQRAIQHDLTGAARGPLAVWLPVFPSAAGFGAIMKNAAGSKTPERWFSQTPNVLAGVPRHKQLANRYLPLLNAVARTGFPTASHVPTADPEPVVTWLRQSLTQHGVAAITGYASSITAVARWAVDHGVDLTGVVAYPSSEPVTVGKLDAMRAAGMTPTPTYAFMPEGTMAIACHECRDEEYHVWDHELAVVTRRRDRGDGSEVDAFCWTSLAGEAPRVLLNVENDDYGVLEEDVDCPCPLGELGLRTRVADIRGISKVAAAGITLEGHTFDQLAEVILPERVGGGPGDYQFVEDDVSGPTTIGLRIHPRLGDVDQQAALDIVWGVLNANEFGVLADSVWGRDGSIRVERAEPKVTKAGKTLSYERLGAAASSSSPAR